MQLGKSTSVYTYEMMEWAFGYDVRDVEIIVRRLYVIPQYKNF